MLRVTLAIAFPIGLAIAAVLVDPFFWALFGGAAVALILGLRDRRHDAAR